MQTGGLRKKLKFGVDNRPKLRYNIARRRSRRPARHMECAAVAHLVERHLAKVEVASSSLVGRSKNGRDTPLHMVAWPSGKAKVCKTFIHQFKSGRHLQDPRAVHGGFSFAY